MFDRYTVTARKAVFLARYEASQFGSEAIEAEHLLLGILGTDTDFTMRWRGPAGYRTLIREQVAKRHPARKSVSTSIDMPLSAEARRALSYAADEAISLKQSYIGVEHLLLGILREENSFAAGLLGGMGFTLEKVRESASRPTTVVPPPGADPEPEDAEPEIAGSRDLTRAAREGALGPLIGRERELDRAIQILSRRGRNNVVLIGEPGVGKTAIVEGLAQRIADGNVPPDLAQRRVLAIDAATLATARRRVRAGGPPEGTLEGWADHPAGILCVEGLFDLASAGAAWSVLEAVHFLEPVLEKGAARIVATGTPLGFRQTTEKAGALARHFEAVYVLPPGEEDAAKMVMGVKEQYERFHGVVIGEEAIAAAVRASGRFLKNRQLPDRAIDLIDEASARLKLRREGEPREVIDLRRRLRQHTHRMENAIVRHEFEKAREHAAAERTDRETLLRLLEERKANGAPRTTLEPEDIEAVIADRTGAPLTTIHALMQQADHGDFDLLLKELGAQVPLELREGVAFLAAWLASCSPDDAEKLASSIRAIKGPSK